MRKNDLITPAVTSIENIGKLALIDNDYNNVTAGGFVFIIRPHYSNDTFAKYMLYALQSSYFNKQMKAITKKSGQAFYNLGKERLIQLIVPIPPIEEQARIVNYIEKFTPLLKEYNELETESTKLDGEIYDKLKKSILQYAIQGKLVPQDPNDEPASVLLERIRAEKKAQLGKKYVESYIYKGDDNCYYEKIVSTVKNITEEIPFELPVGWEWQRFSTITKLITCGYAATPEYVNEGMPFLSARNVKPYSFLPSIHKKIKNELFQKLTQKSKPEKGDILMTRVGAGIGEACIIDIDFDFAIYVSLTLIKLGKAVVSEYVLHWLNSPIGISIALKNIYGKDSSQGNLNVDKVRDFLFPLPPLSEQELIVEKIKQIFDLL